MKIRGILSYGSLMFCLGAISACGGSSGDGDAAGTGRLTLGLTDAPIEQIASVTVAFMGIELKPAGDGPPLDPVIFDEDSCDDFNADSGTCSINLLALTGDVREVVFSDSVPAGEYNQVRLLVDADRNEIDSFIQFENGEMCPIWIPSGNQTGLKIVSGITVTANGVSDYTLDFDVRSSLTVPPGLAFETTAACTENYILKPAIRIIDSTETGTIAGTVSAALLDASADCELDESTQLHERAAVYVFENFDGLAEADDIDSATQNANPVTSASVIYDSETMTYTYEAGFLLAPEDYLLALTCTAGIDMPDTDEFDPSDDAAQDFSFIAERTVSTQAGQTVDASF